MEHKKSGVAILIVVIFLGILSVLTSALIANVGRNWTEMKHRNLSVQSFWLAEAGIEKAIFEMGRKGTAYTGEEIKLREGTFIVTVRETGNNLYEISSIGKTGNHRVKKTIITTVLLEEKSSQEFVVIKKQWKLIDEYT